MGSLNACSHAVVAGQIYLLVVAAAVACLVQMLPAIQHSPAAATEDTK